MPIIFKAAATQLIRAVSAALLIGGAVGSAQADGFVTTNEAVIDLIFGQASFGTTPIDIRFGSTITIYNTDLLEIDSEDEFNFLSTYETGTPTVSMFFTDHINFCAVAIPNIAGCGSTPGSLIAIDSFDATESFGASVVAHELGHNLSLEHVEGTDTNLMNPAAFNGTQPAPVTADQVAQIFTSPLVQHDAAGYYIYVTPFAIVASIPEPSTYALMAMGLGLLCFLRQRRSPGA